jgi:hypothetical protein
MKVAAISTFRTQCGVGLYQEDLSYELTKLCDLKIFAEELSPPQTETQPLRIDIKVEYENVKKYSGTDRSNSDGQIESDYKGSQARDLG